MNDNVEFAMALRRLGRLPTLETQLVEAFRTLEEYGPAIQYTGTFDLKRGNFRLYARSGFWKYCETPLWGFTIAKVELPPRYCGRGWFRAFSEIVYHVMPHDFLVFEVVSNRVLNEALRRKPDYHCFRGNWFARGELFRKQPFDPLALRPIQYQDFVAGGGRINPLGYSPVVTRSPGHDRKLSSHRHDRTARTSA
jgi:hypothetical protein